MIVDAKQRFIDKLADTVLVTRFSYGEEEARRRIAALPQTEKALILSRASDKEEEFYNEQR